MTQSLAIISDGVLDSLAARHMGLAVFWQTKPPHKGEFRWVLLWRDTHNIVAEGYERGMTRALRAGALHRRRLWRERADSLIHDSGLS